VIDLWIAYLAVTLFRTLKKTILDPLS